jgi:hypothetical protein
VPLPRHCKTFCLSRQPLPRVEQWWGLLEAPHQQLQLPGRPILGRARRRPSHLGRRRAALARGSGRAWASGGSAFQHGCGIKERGAYYCMSRRPLPLLEKALFRACTHKSPSVVPEAQAVFCRRRQQPRRPTLAKIIANYQGGLFPRPAPYRCRCASCCNLF